MKLSYEDYDQISVVTLRGEFTADSVEAFRKLLSERLTGRVRDFVLDVSGMEFIDSEGLESLLWLQAQCGERLGQVRLAGTGASVAKILEMTRLSARFDSHGEVAAAVKSLR